MIYAELNEKNYVIGVKQVKEKLDDNFLVEIKSYDTSLPGKFYDRTLKKFLEKDVDERVRLKVRVDGEQVSRKTIAVSTETTIQVEAITPDGKVFPINDSFAVPMKRMEGPIERTIGVSLNNGLAVRKINWPNSGEFEINESLVNKHLPKDKRFKMDRIVFSVYE